MAGQPRHRRRRGLSAALALLAPWSGCAQREPLSLSAPWACDQTHRVSLGHKWSTHRGDARWAWDFELPVGAAVHAPLDGVVRAARDDSARGGCAPSFAPDANYLVIAQPDGREVLLVHLATHSLTVRVGDVVRRGQQVAQVGLTGRTCGPHLHLQAQRSCQSWSCASLPAQLEGHDPDLGASVTRRCDVALDRSER